MAKLTKEEELEFYKPAIVLFILAGMLGGFLVLLMIMEAMLG